MIGTRRVICVVPARLNSKRFKEKVLCSIHGKPILEWIFKRAKACAQFDEVLFAIDHHKTAKLIESFGGSYMMTSTTCLNGTERLIEVMQKGAIHGDIWVNWQGDEPFIHAQMIDDLLPIDQLQGDVFTLKKRIDDLRVVEESSVVKVVTDKNHQALYFSRAPIPFAREGKMGTTRYYKHIGLYAYTQQALEKIAVLPPCEIEMQESLEQLRFLYYGLKIRVFETQFDTLGIDEPEDLLRASQVPDCILT